MNRKSMIMLAVASLAAGGNSPAASDVMAPTFAHSAAPAGRLSLLTYNVNDLPWPLDMNREARMRAIGDRLAALRAEGHAPQVVVLQEAFTRDAQAIARRAGYRFTVLGPASSDPRPESDYASPRSLLKGEGVGPLLSSGLVMMSDFRISDVRRAPFPAGACSGFDCLANKGMLSAQVAVPGVQTPVEIVTTHFNSATPSGQPEPVSRLAFLRQLAALDRFTARERVRPVVRIYAGDFNMGHSEARLTAMFGYIRRHKSQAIAASGREKRAAMCVDTPDECTRDMMLGSNVPPRHANDWQFATVPKDVQLNPIAREIMFRPDRTGKQFSDHLGLKVVYQFR